MFEYGDVAKVFGWRFTTNEYLFQNIWCEHVVWRYLTAHGIVRMSRCTPIGSWKNYRVRLVFCASMKPSPLHWNRRIRFHARLLSVPASARCKPTVCRLHGAVRRLSVYTVHQQERSGRRSPVSAFKFYPYSVRFFRRFILPALSQLWLVGLL